MQLTITTLDGRIVNLDVSEDLEMENLMAQCEFELSIPSTNIEFMLNGIPLADGKKTLKHYGVKHGDVLFLKEKNPQTVPGPSGGGYPRIDFGSIQVPGGSGADFRPPTTQDLEDPRVMRRLIMDNPRERALLKERNPPLSDALESESEERFVDIYTRQRNERLAKDREQLRLLQMNPMDPEAQRLIAEEIRLKNVESNMESAIEHVPESFGQVIMLYIDCVVNGHPIKAFVDSGAQMTIMSQSCAERCNIMRLVDKRWAGIAKGVGTQKIIGRVHLEQIQIGKEFFPSSFSILENQPMDMLLGLDMLKRHQCVIDLKHNELVIGTTETRTKFLPENELPIHARGNAPPSSDTSVTEMADRELADAMQKSAEEAAGGQSTSTSNKSDTSGTKNSSAGSEAANSLNILPPSVSSSNSSPQGIYNSPAGASSAQRMFPEDIVRRIVQKGYSRHQALEALTETNGDEQKATVILFARNVKF